MACDQVRRKSSSKGKESGSNQLEECCLLVLRCENENDGAASPRNHDRFEYHMVRHPAVDSIRFRTWHLERNDPQGSGQTCALEG